MPIDMTKLVNLEDDKAGKAVEHGMIATVEESSTASRPYAIGERFYYTGKLYIATAPIASGGTITVSGSGQNCKLDVLGDDVSELKTAITEQSEQIDGIEDVVLPAIMANRTEAWGRFALTSAGGVAQSSSTRISTNNFINKDIVYLSAKSGSKFAVYIYDTDENNTYLGIWNGKSTIAKSAAWQTGDLYLSPVRRYNIKILLAASNDASIDTSYASNIALMGAIDQSIIMEGRRLLSNSDDLNNIKEIGVYKAESVSLPTNAPTTSGGVLIVAKINDVCEQIYYSNLEQYYRFMSANGTWNNWQKVSRDIAAMAIRSELTNSDDLNDLIQIGVYNYLTTSVPTNAPVNEGALLFVGIRGNSVVQIAYTTTKQYFRIRTSGGTWYPWVDPTIDYMAEIPVLNLTGDTTGMSKDNAVTLNYNLFGATGTCTCKWQGSSSTRYPKKNYTITFSTGLDAMTQFITYINTRRTANGNVSDLPANTRWGTQTKYCFKANWIDPSMMRNIVCARLWGQIVKSRVVADEIDDNRADAPNYGAIDGFPIEIKLNGTSIGMYTMNIPKDKWLFDMGTESTEYFISGENNGNSATQWKALAVFDGDDYSVEYKPSGVEDSTILASLNAAIGAALEAGSGWEEALATYLDVDSVFDYFIFTCCINNHDALARNILYGTYDGTKWFMSAYDMDTTFGVDPYGTLWFPVVNDRNQFAQAANMHRLAYLMYTYSKTKLKARYQELRSGILSDANVWKELSNFAVLIPERDYAIDQEIWKNMPGTTTANMAQYMDYYKMHCGYLDSEIAALS